MNRTEFVRTCSFLCLGGVILSTGLQSCIPSRRVAGTIEGSDLILSQQDFEFRKEGNTEYRKFLIVDHPQLNTPVCVFRLSENEYDALLMKCTHQGAELQVSGGIFHCAAHGSEFESNGEVRNGPANQPLRKFPVTVEAGQIKISLKA